MPIFSNIDQVSAWLDRTVKDINFNMQGVNESLGYDCAIAIAEGIQERSYSKQMGATEKWDDHVSHTPAAESERDKKQMRYGSYPINDRTGQMLSMASLTANIATKDGGETVEMVYGTGEYPSSSRTGYMEDSDKESTDKEKASDAHAAGRPFFELDENIDNERVMPIVKEALGRFLQERANQ